MVWTSDDDGQSPRAIAQQLRLARRQAPIRQQEEDDDSGSQQLRIVQHQSIFSDDDDDDMTPIEVTRRLQIIRRQAPIRNDDDMQLEALSAPQYPGEWPQPQIHLVVDSNALIDHVDWIMAVKDVLVMSGVVFAICSVVINELDRLKSSPGRLGARTRQVIQHLHHCFSRRDPGVRGQVVSPELSAATNDDRILNYCISLRRTSRVLLFTNDLNFQVKAAIQDVPSIDRNDVFDDYFDEDLVRAFIDCLYNSTIHQL